MAQRRSGYSNQGTGTRNQRQIELFPVNGNTVRKAAAQTAEPAVPHEEELRRRRLAWEEEERAQRSARRVRRNRERALRMNRLYAVFLSVCVCALFGICFLYIQLQSQTTQYKESITALQSEVNDLKADNEEMLQNLETSVDLGEILEYATGELGMDYPDEDQIITYETDQTDTLTQYADVSSASGSSILSEIFGN